MKERIERVVVTLDSACEIEVAIDTAARLAACWQVPLQGIFIEDEALIGLAGLPFASQVTLGAGVEKLSPLQIERHFRALAERAERELAAAAAPHRLEWLFAAIRGPLTQDLLKPRDFVVASVATRPIGGHFRVRARSWSAVALTRHPLLLARRRWEAGGSVLALLRARGAGAQQLLALAAEIAELGRREMTVIGEAEVDEEVARALGARPAGRSLALKTERGAREPAALRERILALDCRLLVLAAEGAQPEGLREIVEGAVCDLLLIGNKEGAASKEPS